RLRGTDLDAGVAARHLRSAVRAQVLAILEIARLLEFAYALGHFVEQRFDRDGVRGRMEITLRRLPHREQRRCGKIEDDVEPGRRGRRRRGRSAGAELREGRGEIAEVAGELLDTS